MAPISTAHVAWYVTGRFYLSSTDGSLQDLGYFIHLQGVEGRLFSGPREDPPGEGTALLTFRSAPFKAQEFSNGGLSLGVDPVGDFTLYLKQQPGASFDDPDSFSAGTPIATFRRVSPVLGGTFGGGQGRSLALNVFTARLVWSTEFEFQGKRYDLKELLPNGITQWGEAGPMDVTPPPRGFSKVVPFVGSAVAAG